MTHFLNEVLSLGAKITITIISYKNHPYQKFIIINAFV